MFKKHSALEALQTKEGGGIYFVCKGVKRNPPNDIAGQMVGGISSRRLTEKGICFICLYRGRPAGADRGSED